MKIENFHISLFTFNISHLKLRRIFVETNRHMKSLVCFPLLLLAFFTFAQNALTPAQATAQFLDSIRSNRAALTAFFQQMPKGGDLHHHFSGSIYAESFVNEVIRGNNWINLKTLDVQDAPKAPSEDKNWVRFSTLQKQGKLLNYRQKLLHLWSVKDYVPEQEDASDTHFFSTFDYFNVAGKNLLEQGLLELKKRAQAEHVQYLETMRGGPSCDIDEDKYLNYNQIFENLQLEHNETALQDTLLGLYHKLRTPRAAQCVIDYVNKLQVIHQKLHLDDSTFTIRYQAHVVRVVEPIEAFNRLILSFSAAEQSPLIVGVNIVAPEDNPISMRDYWLHMQFFKFCNKQFPSVKYAMHAGELTLGLVPSEELTWHINAAVRDAGAKRIGHGVDLAYEANPYALLDFMREHHIAIEVNLTSNEFILRVKDDRHPILLYKNAGVPIVISTDDAGVLRSNLTEQYVLLANRYPSISYMDIKQFVYNSIAYSFIKEPNLKADIIKSLDRKFDNFEALIYNQLQQKSK